MNNVFSFSARHMFFENIQNIAKKRELPNNEPTDTNNHENVQQPTTDSPTTENSEDIMPQLEYLAMLNQTQTPEILDENVQTQEENLPIDTQDISPENNNTDSNETRFFDKNGNLIKKVLTTDSCEITYTYKNGQKTSCTKTFPDGAVIKYTYKYDSYGNLEKSTEIQQDGTTIITKYLNGEKTSSEKISSDGTVYKYTYKNGLKTSCTKTFPDGAVTKHTYKYNNYGNLEESTEIQQDGTTIITKYLNGNKISSERNTYSEDGKKLLSSIQSVYDSDGNKINLSKMTYHYNSDNTIKGTSSYTYKNGNAVLLSKDVYGYDRTGNIYSTTTYTYNKDGKIIAKVKNTYDANRNANPYVKPTTGGCVIEFTGGATLVLKNGETAQIPGHYIIVTSADGKTVTQYDVNGDVEKYTVDGVVQQKTSEAKKATPPASENKENQKTETVKDEKGNIIKKIKKDSKGKILSEIEYIYENNVRIGEITRNYKNNNIEEIITKKYSADGKTCLEKATIGSGKTKSEVKKYNEQGQLISTVMQNSHGEKLVYKYTYEQNGNDNVTILRRTEYMADGTKKLSLKKTFINDVASTQIRYLYHYATGKIAKRCEYEFLEGQIYCEHIIGYSPSYYTTTIYDGSANWYLPSHQWK